MTQDNNNYNLLNAFKKAVQSYKPWHQPHWHSQGAKDPLYAMIQKAEDLGIMSPEIAQDELNVEPDEYELFKSGENVPDRKGRKKFWKHFKNHCGIK